MAACIIDICFKTQGFQRLYKDSRETADSRKVVVASILNSDPKFCVGVPVTQGPRVVQRLRLFLSFKSIARSVSL